MGVNLNINSVNQISKDMLIYEKDDVVTSISLVLKGRVLVQTNGVRTILGSGNFLGVCDLGDGVHSLNYKAFDNVVVYTFAAETTDDLRRVFDINKEYQGLLLTSNNFFIHSLNSIFSTINQQAKDLSVFLKKHYEIYQSIGRQFGTMFSSIATIENLDENDTMGVFDHSKIDYFKACCSIPVETQKQFYSGSQEVCLYHITEQKEAIALLLSKCKEAADDLYTQFRALILDETCLFRCVCRAALDFKHMNMPGTDLITSIDEMIEMINTIEKLLIDKVGMNPQIDRDSMEQIYYTLLSGQEYDELVKINESRNISILDNSLDQIMDYIDFDKEKASALKENLDHFNEINDKFERSDKLFRLRKEITTTYYEIYNAALRKSLYEQRIPLAVELLLKYGFLSEKLLSEEQLSVLLELEDRKFDEGQCKVYHVHEWLKEIYEGRKQPSKNEFDMDYVENLRHNKKVGLVTEEQEKKDLEDNEKKLVFEFENMFQYNNRIGNGNITTFVPMLYGDQCVLDLKKIFLTSDRINIAIRKLVNIDYSLFYRDNMYSNPNIGVDKEIVVKEVFPDIILLPVYGRNAIMWQEITGRKRDTPGRLLFPIFLESNLEESVANVLGRFRWELCRTIQGVQWNNIQYKSLTSEYVDYLQFYRKNKDLTEEKREKIKSQLQKNRKNSREVFACDYCDWVLRESTGIIRLNKVVRQMLYTYCPFSKEIRAKVNEQNAFKEAGERYARERAKRNHELDLRIHRIQSDGFDVPQEITITKAFYQDL